ncbi:hypothetical protein BD770DRAFT_446975 [Pilaira anomala]|nr:hypothetical protein BD770DRAFT_446975 [Pilaira anomala]
MEAVRFFNTCVIWTRSTVLILSIVIVVLSLGVYNYNAIPVFLLLEDEFEPTTILKRHQMISDMIQDRRLIATLVAAQASIFCPLFLLMSTSSITTHLNSIKSQLPTSEIWRTFIEQFCQFLMPLGLALSWIFCITFDKRTADALLSQDLFQVLDECALASYIENSLKYIVISILLLEVIIIWISSFKYASILFLSQCKSIRLEEGEDYAELGYEDEDEEENISFISN